MAYSNSLPPHRNIDKTETQALIDLYNQVPIASIPEDWLRQASQIVIEMDKVTRLAKQQMSPQEVWAAPFKGNSVEMTLPEYMQGLKTLVSIDWVIELGKEIQTEISPVANPSSDDHAEWELGEPPERWRKTVKIKKFLRWWPVFLGYDVLKNSESVNIYKYALSPLYTVALHQVVREDLSFTMQADMFGQMLDSFMRYRTNEN